MKALLVLLLASVCAGQQPEIGIQFNNSPGATINNSGVNSRLPAPLKCGKYEHVDDTTQKLCAILKPEQRKNVEVCRRAVPFCAPNIHEVTEKEWQALVERLKNALCVDEHENFYRCAKQKTGSR